MKYLKSILAVIILTVAFGACEKEEISYAFQEISAPTDVTAVFDITQDDTGVVTVTPSGEGAQEFQVYWGDVANEEPELVTPGGSLEHTYEEGQFKARVIAVGSTGLTSEFTQMLNVSFSAPENLEVTIDQSDPNPLLVKISASADNATMFDVFWGDVDDEEATPLMPNETVEHIYPAAGEYTVRVIAKGASATTVEYTEDITVSEASGVIVLPITFDDPSVNYAGNIEGAFSVVDNPAPGGANDVESKVGAIENAGDLYEAIVVNLGEPVDFNEFKTLKMKFWSTTPMPVLMKFEGGVDGERANEVLVTHGGTGWENLSFDFENEAIKSFIDGDPENGEPFVPTGKYSTLVIFAAFGEDTAGTFYFDDVEQEGASGNCEAEMDENIDPAAGDINWTFKTNDFAHSFEPFGNIASEIVSNPDPTGINTSCNVQSYVKTAGCELWSGVGKGLDNAIDLTTSPNTTFKLMVYGESKTTTVTLQLEFEPFPDVDPLVAINQEMTKVGEWEELTFDFSEHTDKTFKSIIVYFDRDQECDDAIYYFDNLKQVPSDDVGNPTEPVSAAPAPGQSESDVISMFSDSYTDVAIDTWRTDWSSATLEDVTIDGSAMKKYSELSFVGIEAVSAPIDASGMTHFRTDVWSADFEEFKIKLVDFGADGMFGGGDDVEHEIVIPSPAQGQWVSLDIPLSDFTGLTTRSNIAQLIYSGSPSGGNTVFVDNVYFYDENSGGGNPTEPVSAAPAPGQSESDVISMFSDSYTDVAIDTWRTDWSSATLEDVTIDGSAMKKYSELSFVGIEAVSAPIDASGMTHFRTDVWSADFEEFKIKLVDFGADGMFGGGDDVEHEIVIPSPAQGQWVSLDIPLSDFTGLTTRSNIAQLIYSGSPSGGNTVFVDNVYFYDDGSGSGAPTEPVSAAPAPGQSESDVISMFSDSYTDVAIDTWRTDWSSATLEDVTIDGSAMKKYSELSFVGVEAVSAPIDASGMTHFRTDVWSADFEEFKVKLVDFGADGMFGGGDDVEHEIVIPSPAQGQWVSLDIPLSDFTGLTTRSNIAQLIYSGSPSGGNTVFVDNVYFYDDGSGSGAPTEPVSAAPTPGVDAANVISMFSDTYDDVAVDTWRTDWSSANLEDVSVAGNATKKYSELNFVGIETVSSQIDASSMTQFHLDVWSADFAQFRVKLVDFGADGAFGGGDDVEHEIVIESPAQGEWISLELDLSDFTGLTTRANIAQLILSGDPSGNITVYVDNVYFHN